MMRRSLLFFVKRCLLILTLAAESVATDSCHLTWPTDQSRPAALLWLVVNGIPQSFAAAAKTDILVHAIHLVRRIRWQPLWLQFFAFTEWPVK